MITLTREQANFAAKVLRAHGKTIYFDDLREQYTALADEIERQLKESRPYAELSEAEKAEWVKAEGNVPPEAGSFAIDLPVSDSASPTQSGPGR